MSEKKTPGLLKRLFRRLVTLTLTVATFLGAGLAVTYGAQVIQDRSDAAASTDIAELIPVQATPLIEQDGYTLSRQFTGQVEAAQTTDLAFEFGGRVAQILVQEGDIVTAGTSIAQLGTALLQTELARLAASRDALQAQLDLADVTVERSKALNERGFASTQAFDQARFSVAELTARIAETTAGIENVQVQIAKSTLSAPFDGQIGARISDTGATVSAGAPVVTLLEQQNPKVRVGLPVALSLDPSAVFSVMINGTSYAATLDVLRPDVDPQTRTRTAVFQLQIPAQLAFGQTATIAFEQRVEIAGYWVPMGSLREGMQGLWTVLMVDPSDTVRSAAVELLHVEAQRAFVRGSFPEGALLIAQGPHRVTPGQKIRQIGG
jgi:RND family efflux transporter MFP subunit